MDTTASSDSNYFTSYEELSVHELMLKDEPRTRAYQLYIESNAHLFKDKIVVDVGAGTGILSLFAARAGAKKVYAIEASNLAALCKEIIKVNDYESTIEVINSLAEEACLPIGQNEADVLMSEWMGFYLLHEAMLSSVIYARDKWLKKEGLMVPNTATIFLCPVNMNSYMKQNYNCWSELYGFNFEPLKEKILQKNLQQPLIENITPGQCLANPEMVAHFHLRYVATEDLIKIHRNLSFTLNKYGMCHGFACWFDCKFEAEDCDDESSSSNTVLLSTSPESPSTHWKQTVIMMPDTLMVSKDEVIKCAFDLLQDRENLRRYNISIEIDDEESESEDEEMQSLVQGVEDEEVKGMLMKVLK